MIATQARWIKETIELPKTALGKISLAILVTVGIGATITGSPGCQTDRSREAIIVGGSMVPYLFGEHLSIKCEDCQYRYQFDVKLPKQGRVVCPNCGFGFMTSASEIESADHVQLKTETELKRWDVVALKRDGEAYASVKRIVGLPGETIEIVAGDIFANSKRIQKTLDVQDEIKIPVYDSRFRPIRNVPDRWVADEIAVTGWARGETGYEYSMVDGQDKPSNKIDWLTYHHWRGFRHRGQRVDEFPIEDSYAYNQTINRSVVPVSDLYLSIDLEKIDSIVFAIRLNFLQGEYEFQFNTVENKMTSFTPSGEEDLVDFPALTDSSCRLVVTTIDSRLRVVLDESCLFNEQLADLPAQSRTSARPFSVGVSGGSMRLSHVRIFRDIYYRALTDSPKGGFRLKSNEFFLLGDNVPVSIDSRHWGKNGVKRADIFGKLTAQPSNNILD